MTAPHNLTTGSWSKIRGHIDIHRVTPLFLATDRHPDPWTPAVADLIRSETDEGRQVVYVDASVDGSNAQRLVALDLDWAHISVRATHAGGSHATIERCIADDIFDGDNAETLPGGDAVLIIGDVIALLHQHPGDPGTAWLDLQRSAARRTQPVVAVVHGLDHHLLRDVHSASGAYRFTEVATGEEERPWDEAMFVTLRATGQLPSARITVLG